MPVAKYKKHLLNYSITGEGPCLVLLHGFGEDARMWTDYSSAFDTCQVITIDLPGFGQSEYITNATIPIMAESIKTILDQEAIDKCVLIGHSMGGYVSLAFAKLYSHRLLGFGLFHSHPYPDSAEKKEGRTKAIEFVKQNGVPIFIKRLMPMLFNKKYASTNNNTIDKMVYYGSQTSQEGTINGLLAMRDRIDNSDVLKNTKLPVLFIIGKQDAAVPLTHSLNQVHLPDLAAIHIYENVGHMGMFEKKQATIMAIRDFMAFCSMEFIPS